MAKGIHFQDGLPYAIVSKTSKFSCFRSSKKSARKDARKYADFYQEEFKVYKIVELKHIKPKKVK